jgi:hypothetical protein
MGLGFHGTDAANKVSIGDFAIRRDFGFFDEEYGASALDTFAEWSVESKAVG